MKEWLNIKETPLWFERSLESKEYAAHAITLSLDLEGSINERGIITIYQTGIDNKPLLFLLSLISHYHKWNPNRRSIFDNLKNGYIILSAKGSKEIYKLSNPVGNPKKDEKIRKLLNLPDAAELKSGWSKFIIQNEAVELIALAMEEEFMIKSLCLRLKKDDPTQTHMYEICKKLDLITSDSQKSMKVFNGFKIRIDRLPFIYDKTRTFCIPYKRDKILQLIERHKRNIKGTHRYSSRGIKIGEIVYRILVNNTDWMTSREVLESINRIK